MGEPDNKESANLGIFEALTAAYDATDEMPWIPLLACTPPYIGYRHSISDRAI